MISSNSLKSSIPYTSQHPLARELYATLVAAPVAMDSPDPAAVTGVDAGNLTALGEEEKAVFMAPQRIVVRSHSSERQDPNVWVLAGPLLAVGVLMLAALVAAFCCCRRRHAARNCFHPSLDTCLGQKRETEIMSSDRVAMNLNHSMPFASPQSRSLSQTVRACMQLHHCCCQFVSLRLFFSVVSCTGQRYHA